jgi:hypothetical protein
MQETNASKASAVIHVNPRAIVFFLFSMITLLVTIHMSMSFCDSRDVCGGYTAFSRNHSYLFKLDNESNLPTWFSVIQLAATSLAIFITASFHAERRGARSGWIMLGVMFLYMSLDEATDLHGAWIGFLPEDASLLGQRSGFDWVLPGLMIVLLISAMFLPWLKQLPRKTLILFIIAAATYVLGGMGLELIGAFTFRPDPSASNLLYGLVATAEETLEMLGVAIMLFAVLDTWRGSQIVVTGSP